MRLSIIFFDDPEDTLNAIYLIAPLFGGYVSYRGVYIPVNKIEENGLHASF